MPRARTDYLLAGRPITSHALSSEFSWPDVKGPFRVLSEEQAGQWNQDGYFVLKDALDEATLELLKREIDPQEAKTEAFLEKQKDGKFGIARAGEITFTTHMVLRSESLRELCSGKLFQDLCHDLIGDDARLYWDQAVYKKPRTQSPFPWHQDNGYNFVEPQSYLTCWIAINDATEDNGCPWVVPGLHRRGTLAHERTPLGFQCVEDPPGAMCAPARAGSIVVFSSLTPHATGPNRTDRPRKAYIVQYAHGVTERVAIDEETGERTTEVQADPKRQFMILERGQAPRR